MQQSLPLPDDATVVALRPRAQAWTTDPLGAFQQWLQSRWYTPRPARGAAPKAPRLYSASAQRTYLSLFARYLAHLQAGQTTLVAASPAHVDSFLKVLSGRQHGLASHETKRRALVLLERVYAELVRLQLARHNPTRTLFRIYAQPPQSRAETTVLGAEQLDAVREHIRALPVATFEQARHAAMLAVMVSCGITGEDLRHIELSSLRRDRGLCLDMPRTASRNSGRLHLGTFATPILERYLRARQDEEVRSALLFPSTPAGSNPISHQTLHRYVIRALDAAGVRDRVGAQRILRATLAVQLLQANVSRDDVRKTLRLYQNDQVERYERYKRVLPPF
jgi:site-specific recombinase XerD